MKTLKFSNRSFQNDDARKVKELREKVVDLSMENEKLQGKLTRIHQELTASQTELSANGERQQRSYDLNRNYITDDYSPARDRYTESPAERHEGSRRYPADDLAHKPIIKSSSKSRDYDDHYSGPKFSSDYERKDIDRSARYDYKLDDNYNFLPNHNLTTSRYKSSSSRQRDEHRTTSSADPTRVSHPSYNDPTEHSSLSQYAKENVDLDSILAPVTTSVARRERKAKRERPHSFHGGKLDFYGITRLNCIVPFCYFHSPHLKRDFSSSQHNTKFYIF